MRCHVCGRMDALIRGIELPIARFTLRAHVDCKWHSEYRAVSHKEVEESNKAFTRYLDHVPEMLELLGKIRNHIDSTCRECESKAIVPKIDALLDKIEGGRDAA